MTLDQDLSLTAAIDKMRRAVALADEGEIRRLLGHWVSGLEPAVARGPYGEIIGLCDADAPVGSRPFIFWVKP